MSIKSRIATRALKFLPKNMLRSAGSAVSSLGRGAVKLPGRAIRTLGKGALLGAGAGAVMGGGGQQVGGFGQLAGANIAANDSNGGLGGNNTVSALPVAQGAANNGKNTTVNRNALESSSENLNDVERELVQIKEELKEINAKTVPPETFQKAGNADEGSIKDMFSLGKDGSKKKKAMVGGLQGAAGMAALVAGMAMMNKAQGETNTILAENKDENGRLVNKDKSEIDFFGQNSGDSGDVESEGIVGLAEGVGGSMKDNLGEMQTVSALTKPKTLMGRVLNAAGQAIAPAANAIDGGVTVGKTGRVVTGLEAVKNTVLSNTGRGINSAGNVYSLTGATGKVSQVVPKGKVAAAVAKIVAAKAAQGVMKAIPVVGTVFGIGSSLWRTIKGDFLGAGLDLAGAVASLAPGIGTAAAMTTMSVNLSRDVYESIYGNFPAEEPDVKDAEGNVIQSGESVAAGRMRDIGAEMAKQLGEWASSLSEGDAAAIPVGDADETITIDGVGGDTSIDSSVTGSGGNSPSPIDATSNSSASGGGRMGRSRAMARARQQSELDSQTGAVNDTSAGSGGGAPIIIQSGGAPVAPVVSVAPPVVNVITGDEMKSAAMGSARFSNGA